MSAILIQSIIFASSGIFSIGSITIIILLLLSENGRSKGLGYMVGYLSTYSLLGIILVNLSYQANQSSPPTITNLTAPIIFSILGTFLLVLAIRNWRKPTSEENTTPRFFDSLDQVTPLKALLIGSAVTIINFKNLSLFLSALSFSILSDLQIAQKTIVALSVAFIFCLSVIIPVLIYFLFPNSANHVLNKIKSTLETHSRQIGIWLPLIFGLLFILRGINLFL